MEIFSKLNFSLSNKATLHFFRLKSSLRQYESKERCAQFRDSKKFILDLFVIVIRQKK